MAIRDVNRKLAKIDSRCELINNRDGYLYFSFTDDTASFYETESVYVCYYKDNTDAEWVALGETFIATMRAKVEEEITYRKKLEADRAN